MAIELLDVHKQWAKIKAGFRGGEFFKSPVPRQTHRFSDCANPMYKEGMGMNMPNSTSAFGGKTFSSRNKG